MTQFRDVVQQLAAAQKTTAGVSLYSRWVNRPLGRIAAAAAVRAGVSANGVTVISILVTAVGIAMLALLPPTLPGGVVIAAVLAAGFALDSADGQVSRYTRTGSAAGEWLDHVGDAGKMVTLHAAVLIGWYRHVDLPSPAWLLVPLAFQATAVLMFSGGLLADLLRRSMHAGGSPSEVSRPSAARALALLPADYGILAWSFALWGVTEIFRWTYTGLLGVNMLLLVVLLGRWFRGLASARPA